ncbi:shewanella-like protein phosphatase 2 [Prunus avium]|uniref:Shewanella-like protein phosphatase 2 n=1 Tax=Prunus avium TaxID=42229 RepID=A0A6P5TQ68_PRUAV|nr:shewanella-like protein phosphatase 2 [Prunus avium]
MEDDRAPPPAAAPAKESSSSSACKDVPNLLSSFVDTFIDFSVSGGLFLLPQNDQNALPYHRNLGGDLLPSPPPLQTYYPPQDRLIAIGDLHGDLEKTKESLRLAKLIDPESGKWVGGSSTLVQIGDVLDRGGDELKILYYLEKLRREAARCGGTVITMHGNHEIMNVEGDFRYVTHKGLDEFRGPSPSPYLSRLFGERRDVQLPYFCFLFGRLFSYDAFTRGLEQPKDPFDGVPLGFKNVKEEFVDGFRARIAALRPNGPISSRFLSKNLTVLVVGS